MTDTSNLGLPCIEGNQAQKHVTHNDALRILDTLVQLAVLDRDLTAPPGSPAEGQRWIVKTGATGAWAGHVNAIAAWQDGAWQFSAPKTGWVAFVVDETVLVVWNGSGWSDYFSTVAIQNLSMLGVGTTADTTNRVSAKLNNALWAAKTVAEGGDGNLRYKMSKESAAKTLSLLMQDNYSGRAEIGLTGDDDFHFKVSPDGTTWYEGIQIAAATGAVTFPNTTLTASREMLTANRTYYVRTDGSDANTGLANTSGGAFATIQKAIDVAAALDLSIYSVTIQVGVGTWTAGNTLKSYLGSGPIVIVGDETTPSNVAINPTMQNAFNADSVRGVWEIRGFKFTSTTAGSALAVVNSTVKFRACDFGTMAGGSDHMIIRTNANVISTGNYTISGNVGAHLNLQQGGVFLYGGGTTVTLTGTPAFSTAFVLAKQISLVQVASVTFSGAATGMRYSLTSNSVVDTNGASTSFLPGNAAGSVSTGAQYA
jgi:hypothetical protein